MSQPQSADNALFNALYHGQPVSNIQTHDVLTTLMDLMMDGIEELNTDEYEDESGKTVSVTPVVESFDPSDPEDGLLAHSLILVLTDGRSFTADLQVAPITTPSTAAGGGASSA